MTSSWTKNVFFGLFVLCVCWMTVLCEDEDEETSQEETFHGTAIVLKPLSQQYVPYDHVKTGDDTDAQYGIGMNAIDASACDVTTGFVYTAGAKYIHIVDFSKATNPSLMYKKELNEKVSDIEVCGSKVAFLIDGNPGRVDIYNLYNSEKNTFELNTTIAEVGFGPSAMIFADNCNEIAVANEGGPYEDNGILLILKALLGSFIDFTKFNDRSGEFVANGVRWPYPNQTTFSQAMEPESITLNTELGTVAYVSLQENNGIAVVDLLLDGVIEYIHALGTKSWENYFIDTSDKDKGIKFNRYDIYSFYQPDGIQFFEVDGVGYVAAANEGETTSFTKDGQEYNEVQMGKEFITNDQLADSVSPELREALKDDRLLGRLEFSNVDGMNVNDSSKFEKLHFFGGRGISVFLASDMSLVWESDYIAEFMQTVLYPDTFNANLDVENADKQKPKDMMDMQSPSKGPECESIEGGEYNGTRVLFSGMEGNSAIMVFSFAQGSVEPKFESIYRHGGIDKPFQKLLDEQNLGDLNPEELKFIPAEHSSTGGPLLLVTGTFSGTLAMYEITEEYWEAPTDLPPHIFELGGASTIKSYGLTMLVLIVLTLHTILFV
ncbi:mesenchyme-specific cell surface glycoprotein-like [Amphiura filiformis]|uniref:mesenchyme-specific cell surface glycoprotein-like n=1 Tax=Amphiura filiformis TaxID=82378 RepID=UPI003B21308C